MELDTTSAWYNFGTIRSIRNIDVDIDAEGKKKPKQPLR